MKGEEMSRAARILVRHPLPVHQRPRKVNAKRKKKKKQHKTKEQTQCKQLTRRGENKSVNLEEEKIISRYY
jgi:hypothetical protein